MKRLVRVGILAFAVGLAGCGDDGGSGDDLDGGIASDAGDGADADPGEEDCKFTPTGQFNPAVECLWNAPAAGQPYPTMQDVVMTPVVANMTDDNGDGIVDVNDIPDIAFVSYQLASAACPGTSCGCCNTSGVLRVVSGACQGGALVEHFSIGATEIQADTGIADLWLDNSGGLALGDIDADGSIDIVGTLQGGGTIAFERDGSVKWTQVNHPLGADHLAATQPALADVDADGMPEVIQGRVVLNGEDGSLQWQGQFGVGTNGFLGPVTASGDLDLSGTLNVLAGSTSYQSDGAEQWSYTFATTPAAENCQDSGFPCDGFTATGNFDADDEGELVIARAGKIYILNHDGTELDVGGTPAVIQVPLDDCARNEGGPPTVADFDGDGQPEIGVAGADFYIVADLECLATPLPAQCSDPGIRWKVANADCSSRVTGSSVFDFDGDGAAEVVYADEDFFRILAGTDGAERLSVANQSHTRLEMPIIVDVDNDGNAEIVFVENLHGGDATSQGIRIYGDATDSWVPTRRIWNQHAYHVTNVTELGGIPQNEQPNWLATTDATMSGLMNNFRQNLPEDSAFAAPDLTVDLEFSGAACTLSAKVCNAGDIVVGAGVEVHFFDNTDQSEIPCDNAPIATTIPLTPGNCETVTCVWSDAPAGAVDLRACVDNAGYACDNIGGNNECREANNIDDEQANALCVPIE